MASYLSYRNVLLNNSTVIASTLNAGSVSYSTLTGSTMSTRAVTVSTLTGSTITISTLSGSTINVSTLTGSTINVSTLSGSTMNISTLTGSTIQATTVFFSTMTASTILTAGSTINLARNVNVPNRFVEVGCDLANSMYLDFHSSDAALPDYSTRIISQGGATTGTGALNMYTSTIGLMATNGVGIGTTVPSAALHVASGLTSDLGNGLKTKYTNIGVTAASAVALNTVYFGTFSGSGPYTFTTNSAGGYGLFAIAYATPGTVYQISVTCYSSNVTSFSITDNNSVVHLVSPLTSTPTTYTTQGYANSNSVIYIGIVTPAPAVGLAITFSSITVQRLDTTATGNVGIGTTNPGSLLTVCGIGSTASANTTLLLTSSASVTTGGGQIGIINFSNNDVIGGAIQCILEGGGVNNNGALLFYTRLDYANYPERMRITRNGNVGIGTTAPSTGLHVNSATQFSGIQLTNTYNGTTGSLGFYIVPSTGGNYINNSTGNAAVILPLDGKDLYLGRTTANNTSLVVQGGTGYVGIGLTNPSVPLHVTGSAGTVNGTTYSYFGAGTGLFISGAGPGSFTALIYATGGIVSTSHVACMTFSSFSDVRIKKNIETYPSNVLDLLLQFRIVSYDHIDFKNGHVKAGLVAQEVEQIAPSCVNKRTEYIPNIYSLGTHSLDGDNVVITVVDANGVPKDVSDVEIGASRKISLKILKNGTTEHDVNEVIITHTSTQFTVRKWDNYCADDKIFVYGTEVDDFRVLDKDVIAMMGIRGIQELASQATSSASQITHLTAENTQLKSAIASLEARLAAAGL